MTTTETTPARNPNTVFLKIERDEFDKVLRVGTPEFLKRVASLSLDELKRGERWINGLRARKTKDTYFTFPVRTEKQIAAGKLYFKAMSDFRTAVRDELAARAVTELFGAPAETEAVAA